MLALPGHFGQQQGLLEAQHALNTQQGLVALDGKHIIGFLTYEQSYPQSSEISWLAVHPDWHHKGVGTKLVKVLENQLRKEGRKILSVKTLSANDSNPSSAIYAPARAFYETIGFIYLMDLDGYWSNFTPVVLIKAL